MTTHDRQLITYSPEEVAGMVKTTKRFVYDQITSGKLRAMKFSEKTLRISHDDLLAWWDAAVKEVAA
jgi:excisionase family DNA binding protein